jgi:hypothetical protein
MSPLVSVTSVSNLSRKILSTEYTEKGRRILRLNCAVVRPGYEVIFEEAGVGSGEASLLASTFSCAK